MHLILPSGGIISTIACAGMPGRDEVTEGSGNSKSMAKRRVEPDEVEYSLLENGLDFIDSGLTQIAQAENASVLKYAVLHLGAGIELGPAHE